MQTYIYIGIALLFVIVAMFAFTYLPLLVFLNVILGGIYVRCKRCKDKTKDVVSIQTLLYGWILMITNVVWLSSRILLLIPF